MFNDIDHGSPPYPDVNPKRQAALAELAYLWKTDDPDWVQQREKDWQLLLNGKYADVTKIEEKLYEAYFKYGKKQGYNPQNPTDSYIPAVTIMLLTPCNSPEDALAVYQSELFTDSDRKDHLGSYIYIYQAYINEYDLSVMPIRHYIQGILGNSYQLTIVKNGQRETNISPNPDYWTQKFVSTAVKALKGDLEYSVVYDCINYFLSLPPSVDELFRSRTKVSQLMEILESTLNNNSLTGAALEFAQTVDQHRQAILDKWAEGEQKMLAEKNKT